MVICLSTILNKLVYSNRRLPVHSHQQAALQPSTTLPQADPSCREWFSSVQDVFSVTYVKRMGVKQGNEYQVLYLYCARSGGTRPKHIPGRDYFPEFTKRRLTRRPMKCGRNCAAFLRIIHWIDGRLTVIGCVEHTGHRMGTALLRLSSSERIVLDEYLYVVDEKVPLDTMLDRIREVEGFTMDGFEVTERNIEDMTRYVMNENEFISLKVLFETSAFFEPESTFAVNLFDTNNMPLSEGISFGIMTSQMRKLWATCSTRATCIEEVGALSICYKAAVHCSVASANRKSM
ncbi:unnamed protein product [Heligmosomoides polygyrus]|uniref:FLYWCH-type domain-containing protein n=1 Tax=Heligmosomoides polygyrus TaxID=6339 RepID=A0A183F7Y4_HELPZ|nr:unnamed protein product [Heligmosomoides polygyrus]